MVDPVFDTIKERRTIHRFKDKSVDEEKIRKILNAGRWAPSWTNSQPWRFIIVKNQEVRNQIGDIVPTVFTNAIREAPVSIVVSVDTEEDPHHFVEDGATATQNMSLMAESLDLGSTWIGVFSFSGEENSSEAKIKEMLELPKTLRIISVLSVGFPRDIPEKDRKNLSELILKEI